MKTYFLTSFAAEARLISERSRFQIYIEIIFWRFPFRMNFITSTVPFLINAAFNLPFCLIASIGNFLILVAFARTPSLLSPSNVFLISLAISDLCVALIAQPVYMAWKLHQHMNQTPTMVGFLGKASMFVSSLLCAVSFMIVSCLIVDRYLAVFLHLRYHALVTVHRVSHSIVLLICFPCLIASSLGAWQPGYFELIAAPSSFLCLLINAVLYFKIYRVVRRHQLQVWNRLTAFHNVSPRNITTFGFRRSFVNIFYVYVVCLVCYVPYMITAINFSVQGGMDAPITAKFAFEVSWTIAFMNSSLNPLLFSWRLKNVRAAVKSTLKELLC